MLMSLSWKWEKGSISALLVAYLTFCEFSGLKDQTSQGWYLCLLMSYVFVGGVLLAGAKMTPQLSGGQ